MSLNTKDASRVFCFVSEFNSLERLDVLDCFFRCQANFAIIQVDQDVAAVAHAQFLHVGELAEAVS